MGVFPCIDPIATYPPVVPAGALPTSLVSRGVGFAGLCALLVAALPCRGAEEEVPAAAGETVQIELPDFEIIETHEEQETWPEEAPSMFPFRRSRLFGMVVEDHEEDRHDALVLNEQLGALQDFNPGEFASTSGSGTPRGFTTPRLRNGLSQAGFPEIILGGRRELLSGFLATYFGRTAPGGILNHVSTRPSPKANNRLMIGGDSIGEVRAGVERSAPLVPKKLHYRFFGEARHREGPQDYAASDSMQGGLVFRYAPDKKTVWMVEIETARVDAVPSGSIVLQRETRGAPRGAPYGPLEDFNTNGPNTSSRRHSGILSVMVEHKRSDDLTLRAGGELWGRIQRELTFNTGAFLLDERIFDGVREPQFNARRQSAGGLHIELDGTGSLASVNHRWVVGMAGSREFSDREQRALPTSVRNTLPVSVRFFDPAAPDYSIVPYSPDVYSRVLALRDDRTDYLGVFCSERVALADDRVYGTFGLRNDWVWAVIDDQRAGAAVPHATSNVQRATYHAGLVWHAWPNRLAVFLNHSTAFQPARRVDARTGRIIGDESTAGVETGVRYVSDDGETTATASIYRLWNQGITRTNPRYNDPVADPLKTQPQYVSSGEEQFSGIELGLRRKIRTSLTLAGKLGWLEAITTRSPDLPEEVDRQLQRTPELTATVTARYQVGAGWLKGAGCGMSYAWIGDHVAVYPSNSRARVDYDAYSVVAVNAGYNWVRRKVRHAVTLNLRNAAGVDLLAAAGRIGGDRALDASYTVRF